MRELYFILLGLDIKIGKYLRRSVHQFYFQLTHSKNWRYLLHLLPENIENSQMLFALETKIQLKNQNHIYLWLLKILIKICLTIIRTKVSSYQERVEQEKQKQPKLYWNIWLRLIQILFLKKILICLMSNPIWLMIIIVLRNKY